MGTEVINRLRELGVDVLVGTRHGTEVDGATAVAVDAADRAALSAAASGVQAIYVCTNPPYDKWATDWPPIVDAVIAAARQNGAKVVMAGNLYPYGRPAGAMTAATEERPTETKGKVRADLWRRLREAHESGEIQAAEVRASDYFGAGAGASAHAGARFIGPLLQGKTARVIGDPDAKHSWAYLPEFAATLVAVAKRGDAMGRVWVAPHAATMSLAELAASVNALAGSTGKVASYPSLMLRFMGLVSPMMREVLAVRYQHTEPYVVDDSETRERLGLQPTPLDDALRATIAWVRAQG